MQKLFITFLVVGFTFICACHTAKLKPGEYPGVQIYFGNGGGFAGAYNEYVLQENGHVYKKDGANGDFQFLQSIERNVSQQLVKNFRELGIEDMTLNEPGNMYYFLQTKEGKNIHKITWGDRTELPSEISVYYNILLNLASGD